MIFYPYLFLHLFFRFFYSTIRFWVSFYFSFDFCLFLLYYLFIFLWFFFFYCTSHQFFIYFYFYFYFLSFGLCPFSKKVKRNCKCPYTIFLIKKVLLFILFNRDIVVNLYKLYFLSLPFSILPFFHHFLIFYPSTFPYGSFGWEDRKVR